MLLTSLHPYHSGNFMTLKQAIVEFSADAMRFAMANAGDGMDDANFEKSLANAAILSITREVAWIEEVSFRREGFATFSFGYRRLTHILCCVSLTPHADPGQRGSAEGRRSDMLFRPRV
jgi:hypothetical protein